MVRLLRRLLVVSTLAAMLILAVGLGGVAASLYTLFGSGKAVTAQGPHIELDELQYCSSVLIDLDRIEISLPDQLTRLPNPQKRLRIATKPETLLTAGVLEREDVGPVLLGSDTCIVSLDSQSWSLSHSALGQPWLQVVENSGFSNVASGTSIAFDVESVASSTLIIELTGADPAIVKVSLDAEVSYPDASNWALGCAISAGVFLALFVALTVIVIVRGTRKSRSAETQS